MTRQEFQNQLTTLPLTPDGVWSADADLIADFNNGNNLQIRYNNESLSWTIIDKIMWVEGVSLIDAIEQWETYCGWT